MTAFAIFLVSVEDTANGRVADHNHFAEDKIRAHRGESKQFFKFANLEFFDGPEVCEARDLGVLHKETLAILREMQYHVAKGSVWVLRDTVHIIGINIAYGERNV